MYPTRSLPWKTRLCCVRTGMQTRVRVREEEAPVSFSTKISDHNVVHLIPTYKSLLKSCKPQIKTEHGWNNEGIETLKVCFSRTNSGLFHCLDLRICCLLYDTFCSDNVLTQKSITMYPNNKPYNSLEVKKCFKQEQKVALDTLPASNYAKIAIDQHVVQRRTCPMKATGPDGSSGFLLKLCSEELA